MKRNAKTVRVPLSVGGLRMGLAYCTVRDKIARGELAGGRDEFGRWYVELPEEDARPNPDVLQPTS